MNFWFLTNSFSNYFILFSLELTSSNKKLFCAILYAWEFRNLGLAVLKNKKLRQILNSRQVLSDSLH